MKKFIIVKLIRRCALALTLANVSVLVLAQSPNRANTSPLIPRFEIHDDGSASLVICHNSSCAAQKNTTFSAEELQNVAAQMQVCSPGTSEKELQRIRIGIWQMELLAQQYNPSLANDLPVNDQEFGVEGRTDCVDNSTNSSTYLAVLKALGHLPGWSLQDAAVRKPWDINRVHWTAVVKSPSGELWSVDSWYRRNGHLPFVMPLENWKREELAWRSPHVKYNRYPKSVGELCD